MFAVVITAILHASKMFTTHQITRNKKCIEWQTVTWVTFCRCVDPKRWQWCRMTLLQVGRHLVRSHNCKRREGVPSDIELLCRSSCPTVSPSNRHVSYMFHICHCSSPAATATTTTTTTTTTTFDFCLTLLFTHRLLKNLGDCWCELFIANVLIFHNPYDTDFTMTRDVRKTEIRFGFGF